MALLLNVSTLTKPKNKQQQKGYMFKSLYFQKLKYKLDSEFYFCKKVGFTTCITHEILGNCD